MKLPKFEGKWGQIGDEVSHVIAAFRCSNAGESDISGENYNGCPSHVTSAIYKGQNITALPWSAHSG